MDANQPKPFPEWSKKKKAKYLAAWGELFTGFGKMFREDSHIMPEKPNWKAKEASK